MIFSCQDTDVRQSVDSLVRSHLDEPVWCDADIRPEDIPVLIFVLVASDVHFASNALYHVVAAILSAQCELLLWCTIFSLVFALFARIISCTFTCFHFQANTIRLAGVFLRRQLLFLNEFKLI